MLKMTKSQEALLKILCENVKTLGEKWYEKNKNKYSDDLYKAWRYLRDTYFKKHDLIQEGMDMMSDEDRTRFKKWYNSLDSISQHSLEGVCHDYFVVKDISNAI